VVVGDVVVLSVVVVVAEVSVVVVESLTSDVEDFGCWAL
jgi:hypothetical protein